MRFMVGCFLVKSGVFLKTPRPFLKNYPMVLKKYRDVLLAASPCFFKKMGRFLTLPTIFLAPKCRFSSTKKGRFWSFSTIFQHPNLTFKTNRLTFKETIMEGKYWFKIMTAPKQRVNKITRQLVRR